jgi:hypothetical protein
VLTLRLWNSVITCICQEGEEKGLLQLHASICVVQHDAFYEMASVKCRRAKKTKTLHYTTQQLTQYNISGLKLALQYTTTQ